MAVSKFTIASRLEQHIIPTFGLEATLRSTLDNPSSSIEYANFIEKLLGIQPTPSSRQIDKRGLIIDTNLYPEYVPLLTTLLTSGTLMSALFQILVILLL